MLGVTALILLMGVSPFDPEGDLASVPDDQYVAKLFPTMRQRMNAYLAYCAPNMKPLAGAIDNNVDDLKAANEAFFAELEKRFPTVCPLVRSLLRPDENTTPDIDSVYAQLQTLQGPSVPPQVKEGWSVVKRDEKIQEMIDAFDPSKTQPFTRQSATPYDEQSQGDALANLQTLGDALPSDKGI